MDVVQYHKELHGEYYALSKKQRVCDKFIDGVKAVVDSICKKHINGLRAVCAGLLLTSEGELYRILQRYEKLFSVIEKAGEMGEFSGCSGLPTPPAEQDDSASACSGDPASNWHLEPPTGKDNLEWQLIQDKNEEVAALQSSVAQTIKNERADCAKLLGQRDEQIRKLQEVTQVHASEIRILKNFISCVCLGEVAKRLNEYLTLNDGPDVLHLTDTEYANQTVQTILNKVKTEFKISKNSKRYKSSLEAFQAVAEGVRPTRNDIAHPEDIHVDVLKEACSRVPERKLLNVLIAVAIDKTYPLRKIGAEADEDDVNDFEEVD